MNSSSPHEPVTTRTRPAEDSASLSSIECQLDRVHAFLDNASVVRMGRAAFAKHEATTEYGREAVQALVSTPALVSCGLQANLTQRASTESWVGVLHSLTEHEHKVSISAYVALTEQHGGPSVHGVRAKECAKGRDAAVQLLSYDISSTSEYHGFVEDPDACVVDGTCPHDDLPAEVHTFTSAGVTLVECAHFVQALRATFDRAVSAGTLSRFEIDGWDSWELELHCRRASTVVDGLVHGSDRRDAATSDDAYGCACGNNCGYDYGYGDGDGPYRFIRNLPPYATCMAQHNLPPRASLLSPRVDVFSHDGTNANPPTLVLDLDETLTHTEVTPIDDADLVFHLQSCGDDAPQPMFVRKRPHVDHFLRTVAQKFEVVIFTASERPYCESILRFLDPHNELIDYVLCREDCSFIQGEYLKDLSALGRDLSRLALVDNRPEMYAFQVDNGIPIRSWFADPHDCELLRLLPSLDRLADPSVTDVRPFVRWRYRTHCKVARAMALAQHGGVRAGPQFGAHTGAGQNFYLGEEDEDEDEEVVVESEEEEVEEDEEEDEEEAADQADEEGVLEVYEDVDESLPSGGTSAESSREATPTYSPIEFAVATDGDESRETSRDSDGENKEAMGNKQPFPTGVEKHGSPLSNLPLDAEGDYLVPRR